ncbi:MAG: hypothetical protein WCK08_05070 [Betaproteobacteria bacterium]
MPLIKINGLAYEFDKLDDEAKGHLRYLAFIDAELEQLAMRMTVMKISRDQIGQRLDAALLRQSAPESPPELAQSPQPAASGKA